MNMQRMLRTCSAWTIALLVATPAMAVDLGENAEYGKITGDFRYRYENDTQQNFKHDANASTARLRLGYQTPVWQGFSGFVEGETIQNVIADQYNDGANKKTQYPSVNDPYDTAVNQAFVDFTQPGVGNEIKLGRQRVAFDTERFVGVSNFRQNDTVHDAVHGTLKSIPNLTLDYVYSDSVHRSLGTRETLGTYDGDMNMVHAGYDLPYDLRAIGYGYYFEFRPYLQNFSTQTDGGRLEWRPKKPLVAGIKPIATAEYAYQTDMGDNKASYSESYHWFELGGDYQGYTLSAIYESLGGNGKAAFQTPLATFHRFNGWVDKFSTTTPLNGLIDYQAWLSAPLPLPKQYGEKLTLESQYHVFDADANNKRYGTEVDVGLSYSPIPNHTILLQGGWYDADLRGTSSQAYDTTKLWLAYELKF